VSARNCGYAFEIQLFLHTVRGINSVRKVLPATNSLNFYRGADKSLARLTSRCILVDGGNISFDASLVIYIYIYIYIQYLHSSNYDNK
jgi:hypothetical protein